MLIFKLSSRGFQVVLIFKRSSWGFHIFVCRGISGIGCLEVSSSLWVSGDLNDSRGYARNTRGRVPRDVSGFSQMASAFGESEGS